MVDGQRLLLAQRIALRSSRASTFSCTAWAGQSRGRCPPPWPRPCPSDRLFQSEIVAGGIDFRVDHAGTGFGRRLLRLQPFDLGVAPAVARSRSPPPPGPSDRRPRWPPPPPCPDAGRWLPRAPRWLQGDRRGAPSAPGWLRGQSSRHDRSPTGSTPRARQIPLLPLCQRRWRTSGSLSCDLPARVSLLTPAMRDALPSDGMPSSPARAMIALRRLDQKDLQVLRHLLDAGELHVGAVPLHALTPRPCCSSQAMIGAEQGAGRFLPAIDRVLVMRPPLAVLASSARG